MRTYRTYLVGSVRQAVACWRSSGGAQLPGVHTLHLTTLGDLMDLVTLDFETYFDTKYSLRNQKMNMSEYIRDDRFRAHMCGIKINAEPTFVVGYEDIPKALKGIKWNKTELLAHNTAFDGLILQHHYNIVPAVYRDTLCMARALHSNEIGASLDEVAKLYGVGNKLPDVLDQTKGVLDLRDIPGLYGAASAYCATDVDLCWAIYQMMLAKKFPDVELELIHLTLKCFCDPQLRIDRPRADKVHKEEIARKTAILMDLTGADTLEAAKKLVGKDEWLADKLREAGVEPPVKISEKKSLKAGHTVYNYAFAKSDEAFLEILETGNEVAQTLVEARLEVKSALNETRALRLLNASAKPNWRLPVGYNYYGAHCVPEDTEVLTPDGWVRIDQWQGGLIAQVDPEQKVAFLPATRYVGPVENKWIAVDAPYLKCAFTQGHTMPYLRQKSHAWGTTQAGSFAELASRKVPLSGVLHTAHGQISAPQMRVLAMVQADGSYETDTTVGQRLTIFVKKPRKIARARVLLHAAGVPFEEQSYPSHPGYVRFVVAKRDWPEWLTPHRKYLGSWLLDSSDEAREALMNELEHWDGTVHNGQTYYYSSEAANADWVATLAHLTGRCATVTNKKGSGNRRTCYSVAIRKRNFGLVRRSHVRGEHKPRRTYCTETITGFWLARHEGRIFVTGNTGRWSGANKMNMQNFQRKGELRKCILAPEGYHVVTGDSAQIEARVLACLAGNEPLLQVFRNKECPYCYQATEMFGHEVVKGRSEADEDDRQIGKVALLALGFAGAEGAFNSMAKVYGVKLPGAQVRMIVRRFRASNPSYVRFWDDCTRALDDLCRGKSGTLGVGIKLRYEVRDKVPCIVLPNGMCLKYPGLRKEVNPDTGYEEFTYQKKKYRTRIYSGSLTENIVQALARIVVAEQMIVVSRKYRLVMMTHDEGSWVVRAFLAAVAAKQIEEIMSVPPTWAPSLPVGSEVKHAPYYCK